MFHFARNLLPAWWQQASCAEVTSAALSKFPWCERTCLLQDKVCIWKLIGQDAECRQLPQFRLFPELWFTDIKHIAYFIIWGRKANESIVKPLAASLQESSGWTQRSWALDGNWIFINSCESVLKQLEHINEFFYYGGLDIIEIYCQHRCDAWENKNAWLRLGRRA